MKTLIPAIILLSLTACKTMPVSCDTAPRVRAAAALALQALDRACPIGVAE